jgi:hypothetical protein
VLSELASHLPLQIVEIGGERLSLFVKKRRNSRIFSSSGGTARTMKLG